MAADLPLQGLVLSLAEGGNLPKLLNEPILHAFLMLPNFLKVLFPTAIFLKVLNAN